MTTRDQILASARSFLGVRFAHQGRSAAEGLDCLGLLIATAEKAGCMVQGMRPSALDQCAYGSQPDTDYLQTMLATHLLPVTDGMQPADILLLHIEERPQHLALVSDYPSAGEYGMIHAYAQTRRVVEHRLDEQWRAAIHSVYRLGALKTQSSHAGP